MSYNRSAHSVRPITLKPPTTSAATDTASQPTPSICNPQDHQSSLAEQSLSAKQSLSHVEDGHYHDLSRFRADQEELGNLAIQQSKDWKSLKYAEFGSQRLFPEWELKTSMSNFLATLKRLENMGEPGGLFNYGLGEKLLSQCEGEDGNGKDIGGHTSIVARQLAEYISECSVAPTFEELKEGAESQDFAFYHLAFALSQVEGNRQKQLEATTYEEGDGRREDEEDSGEAQDEDDGSTATA
jgi:hypothetical protein